MGFMTKKSICESDWSIAVFDVVDFGLYQIIITDANGCTAFENNILIAPPSDLDISIYSVGPSCAGLGSENNWYFSYSTNWSWTISFCSIQSGVNPTG
jgi:hypothetical protein